MYLYFIDGIFPKYDP